MGHPKQPGQDAEAHLTVVKKSLAQAQEITCLHADLATLRAKLEAAERERDALRNRVTHVQTHSPSCWQWHLSCAMARCATLERERDVARAEAECHSKNHDAALDQRDAANALLLRAAESHSGCGLKLRREIRAHLAASPSPAAEGDGAGRETICPACSGSGVIEQGWVDGQCQRCSGTGLDAQPAQGGDSNAEGIA